MNTPSALMTARRKATLLVQLFLMSVLGLAMLATKAYGANTFANTGSLTTARDSHTATLLPNGLVLVTGGIGNGGGILASAELYDIGVGFIATSTSHPILSGQLLLSNGSLQLLPNGSFQFGFTSGSGLAFTVHAATDLAAASINWTALGAPTEISSGNYQFTDQQATNYPQRFYRVSSP